MCKTQPQATFKFWPRDGNSLRHLQLIYEKQIMVASKQDNSLMMSLMGSVVKKFIHSFTSNWSADLLLKVMLNNCNNKKVEFNWKKIYAKLTFWMSVWFSIDLFKKEGKEILIIQCHYICLLWVFLTKGKHLFFQRNFDAFFTLLDSVLFTCLHFIGL